MTKIRVLLTGAGGRIGGYLVPEFQQRYDLRTLDRQPVAGDPNAVIADLQDYDALRAAMQDRDVLVHLAATPGEAPFLDNLIPNNVVGLYHAFQAAKEAGARRIVFASTIQTILGYPEDQPLTITDPVRPLTLYAATKVLGEAMGRWYHDFQGMEFVGIRVGGFQPYESEALRRRNDLRGIWLSPRDAVGLFCRAIEKPDLGFALVFGTSLTEYERVSRQPMRDLLDFAPQDDITVLYPQEKNAGG